MAKNYAVRAMRVEHNSYVVVSQTATVKERLEDEVNSPSLRMVFSTARYNAIDMKGQNLISHFFIY